MLALPLPDLVHWSSFQTVVQDFMDMLPFRWYTSPLYAPLNMVTHMLSTSLPTDVGPKTYVAFGSVEVS